MEEIISTSNIKFYSIGEVAKLLNLAPSTLRYWEKEFEQIKPLTTDFGRRVYTQTQIDIISKIQTLLHEEGMTIKGAKNYLSKPHSETNVTTTNGSNPENNTDLQELKSKLNDLLSYIRKEKKES